MQSEIDYKSTAKALVSLLGGRENITSNAACMTRLRIGLKDDALVQMDAIRGLDGVLGISRQDTLHIVFGPGKVNHMLDAFSELTGLPKNMVASLAAENKAAQKAKYDRPVQRFLHRIGSIFVALLPGIVAAGLINGICNVINYVTGGSLLGEWWYQCIRTMGWALFAYLPILVGFTAAKEFGGSGVLGAVAGALSVSNAAMPLLSTVNDTSILLPFTNEVFNPASGGLLAALIGGMFFAFLEKQFRKIIPDIVDTFLTPLLTLIVGGLTALLVIQPLGAALTDGIYLGLDFVYNGMGALGGFILAAIQLPLVSVGLHQALTPIHIMLNDPDGATQGVNYLLPILMMAGGGQIGAGLALYVKTKNRKLKKIIRDSIPVGMLGIGEPLMYAVTLPLGRTFVTACIGSGFGGAVASILKVGAISQGVSGIFGLLIVQPGQQLSYLFCMLLAYAGGFLVTWFFGVDEERIDQLYAEDTIRK